MSSLDRLAWTLIHFLWQGTIPAAVYAAARLTTRRSNVRYLLACAALACMALAPVATWFVLAPAPAAPVPGAIGPAPHPAAAMGSKLAMWAESGPVSPSLLPWIVAIWLAGATAFSVRLTGGWLFARGLRKKGVRRAPAEWQETLDRLRLRIGVSAPVRLFVAARIASPMVIGWIRPVVLMPIGALTGLAPEQVEALLLHELAHIRRADYLVNLLQGVAEALLFYHPAVWWVSGQIRAEREMCCDDAAVSVCGDVLTYVRTLAELEAGRARLAVAANGGSLAQRIARLLGQPRAISRSLSGPALVSVVVSAITALAVFGQPARPKFEVATIKKSQEQRYVGVRPLPGGRISANAPVRLLIQNGWGLQAFQVIGGPSWIGSDRYAVEAKAADNPPRDELLQMLQPLLEERFHLQAHKETRELPIYELVAAKGGPKLPPSKDTSCVQVDPKAPPSAPNAGQPLPCGRIVITLQPSGGNLKGGKIPMQELVRILSIIMGRTVVDKTGFQGVFDVDFDFQPDSTAAGLPTVGPPDASSDSSKSAIYSALNENLGLKLESTKGPVEVLVIDHIERPTEN